jgi:uncharacterized protein YndB with AHSA1/START domain
MARANAAGVTADGGDATAAVLERTIDAAPERVFHAWLDPATIARWLSPTALAEAETDPRVNGSFRVRMLDPDGILGTSGAAMEHTGRYLEIDPPRRLAFTWSSPFTGPEASVVTIEFVPAGIDGRSTRLKLRHERLPADAVASHRNGWGSILDNLARVVEAAG